MYVSSNVRLIWHARALPTSLRLQCFLLRKNITNCDELELSTGSKSYKVIYSKKLLLIIHDDHWTSTGMDTNIGSPA